MNGCRTIAHHLFRSNTSSHLSVRSVFPSKFLSTRIFGSSLATGLVKRCASPRRPLSRTCSGQSQHIRRVRCACSVGERSERKERCTLHPDKTSRLILLLLVVLTCRTLLQVTSPRLASAAHQEGTSPKMFAPKTQLRTMSPKLDTMYRQPCVKIQLAGCNPMRAQLRSSPRESAVPNVSKKEICPPEHVTVRSSGKANACSGRPECEYIENRSRNKASALLNDDLRA